MQIHAAAKHGGFSKRVSQTIAVGARLEARNQDTQSGPPPMQIPSADGEAVTEVSGGYEGQYFFKLLDKPPDWNQNLQTICDLKRRAVHLAIERLETNLAGLKSQNLEQRYFDVASRRHHTLAQLYSYQGEMNKAIEHFQSAYQLAADHHLKELQLGLEEKLGIAEMRRGEIDNCLHSHNAKSCIFPISREGRHKLESGSREATKHFLNYLDQKPEDIEAKWLLNIAYMTLGEYPNGVPQRYLIPPGVFESKEDIGRFVDVAPSVGLDVDSQAGGVIVEDFDNDGFLDAVTSSMDACEPLHYFHNDGDGTFTDRTAQTGLSKQLGG